MPAQDTISQLIRPAFTCAVVPIMGRQKVNLALRGVKFTGLRERIMHLPENTFVKIFVDEKYIRQTAVAENTLTPSWKFEPPMLLSAYPSSAIKLILYRQHRYTDPEQLGHTQASAWKFLSSDEPHHLDSKSLPTLTVQVKLSLDEADENDGNLRSEGLAHRLKVLSIQHQARMNSEDGFSVADTAMGYLSTVLDTLQDIASAIPLANIAARLFKAIEGALNAHRQIDAAVKQLLRSLREAFTRATACCGNRLIPGAINALKRAVHLAGESAEILDAWVHDNTAARAMRMHTVHDRIRSCQEQLSVLRDDLRFDVELAVCNAIAEKTPVTMEYRPEQSGSQTSSAVAPAEAQRASSSRRPSPPRTYRNESPRRGREDNLRGRTPSPARGFGSIASSRVPRHFFSREHRAISAEDESCIPEPQVSQSRRGTVLAPIILPHTPETPITPLPLYSEETEYETASSSGSSEHDRSNSRQSISRWDAPPPASAITVPTSRTPRTPITPLPMYCAEREVDQLDADYDSDESYEFDEQDYSETYHISPFTVQSSSTNDEDENERSLKPPSL